MKTPLHCEFEAQSLAAVLEYRWPHAVETPLRQHIAGCSICSEVVAMADAFAAARQDTRSIATVPDASRVWWIAQIRARREAAEEAARPILATQIAAFAWAIGILVVCLGGVLAWFQPARVWIGSMLVAHGFVIAIAAAIVLLLPTAAYFAMGKE